MSDDKMESSFLMLKPDALERDLFNEVLSYFRDSDLRIPAMTREQVDEETVEEHYSHVPDEILEGLHDYFDGEEVVIAVVYGENAIERTREIAGSDWKPEQNPYGTIRGDIHNPDSPLYWENGIAEEDQDLWERRYHSEKTLEGEPTYTLVHTADPEEDLPQEVAKKEAARFFGEEITNYMA